MMQNNNHKASSLALSFGRKYRVLHCLLCTLFFVLVNKREVTVTKIIEAYKI